MPPGNTIAGFDTVWNPGGPLVAAVAALVQPPGEAGHAARARLATAYLRVVKQVDLKIRDRPPNLVRDGLSLYNDIREFAEGTDGDDVQPELPGEVTGWEAFLEPEPGPPLEDAPGPADGPAHPPDALRDPRRNHQARYHAYQALSNSAVRGNAAGGFPFAPKPDGAARFHFLGLVDVIRLLYPPGASQVTGWNAGGGGQRGGARGGRGGGGAARGRGRGGAPALPQVGGAGGGGEPQQPAGRGAAGRGAAAAPAPPSRGAGGRGAPGQIRYCSVCKGPDGQRVPFKGHKCPEQATKGKKRKKPGAAVGAGTGEGGEGEQEEVQVEADADAMGDGGSEGDAFGEAWEEATV